MKKVYLIDYIAYLAVRVVGAMVRAMPLPASLWLARRFGDAVFFFNLKRRAIGYANLKAALGKRIPPCERTRIIRNEYRNLAMSLSEVLRFPSLDERYIKRYIEFENLGRIDEALAKGKGAIMLTAHFGNWELSSVAAAMKGYTTKVLAREQKYRRLYNLLNSYREITGCKVISKGMQTREIIKGLRQNEIIGMLIDQDGGKNGAYINFFGRPASTPQGAFAFSAKTGAEVLPAFSIKMPAGRNRIVVEERIEGAEREGLQEFSDRLALRIEEDPSQWLWMHKRWKSTPVRYAIILDDEKPGHLVQSRAALKQIENILTERYENLARYNPEGAKLSEDAFPLLRYKIIKVRYKTRLSRFIMELCGAISNKRCQGCMRCLKLCATEETYNELMSTYADIVISCGAALLAPNILMKTENNARSVVVMKPNIFALSRFDLAVIPRHDRPKEGKNVLLLDAALNLIDKTKLQDEAARLCKDANLKLERALVFGLLIGGDSKNFVMMPHRVKEAASGIKKLAERYNADILVTTSRRTSREVESVLKEEFKNYARCKLLLIANERNIAGAAAGILGLSSILIVSGDSVSMVSEAVQSGKYVVAFMPGSGVGNKKTEFLSRLEKNGYIKTADSDKIDDAIVYLLENKPTVATLADNEKLRDALEKIV